MPVFAWVGVAILVTGVAVLVLFGDGGQVLGIEPGQLAALTAMLALLVVLLRGRLPDGPAFGSLAVWGLLLALLVGGYVLWERFAG